MNVARANREAWIAARAEGREALRDPGKLPDDELSESVEYTGGSDEAFLRRLWCDLYGDESPDAPGSHIS